MSEYYTILTDYGLSELTRAKAGKTPINLSYVVVGDGEITPSEAMKTLKNQKYETPINTITQDEKNPAYLNIEAVIPMEVGGFYVREVGILDDKKNLFAIGNIPETYKPLLTEGSAKDLVLKIVIEVANASSVELKIDPGAVLATREWSTSQMNILLPAGTIIQSVSKSTPQGYLKCNGASISRSDYKRLFDVIGLTFGSDDDETFKLPDLRGRFIRGFSDNSTIDKDREFGSTQEDDLKRHTHGFAINFPGTDKRVKENYEVLQTKTYNHFAINLDGEGGINDNAMVRYNDTKTTSKGKENRGDLTYTGNSDEVRVKNIALNFFIKY